ncbi:DnaD domain protein, partial [Enterococcus faecalis]|uniref:DnaD domain protein n=1 Tax=Enterococcus faecalis TaxID=1351 RepID=UPI003D6A7AEA
ADYQRLPQESIVQSKLGQSQGSSSENDCLKTIYHFYEENDFGTLASKTSQDFTYWLQHFIQKGTRQQKACQIILH